jgi:glucokinase
MDKFIVAVDMGGTNTRCALCRDDGTILARTTIKTQAVPGPTAGLARISEAIRTVIGETPRERLRAIAVAAPGPLDPWTGILYAPPNLIGWGEVHLREYLERSFHLTTYVGNDANVAALGEWHFGAGQGVNHMVYMTVSTGIGGGVIANGTLFLGAQGFAGEVGHQTIDIHGPRCNCGNYGCLEALASGPAIARAAQAALQAGEQSIILDLAGGIPDMVTAEHVTQAAQHGDVLAMHLIRRAGMYIGVGIANIIAMFNPQLVVVGGGVSNAGPLLFSAIETTVAERAMPIMRQGVRIVPAALGDDVGILGGVALVLSQQV